MKLIVFYFTLYLKVLFNFYMKFNKPYLIVALILLITEIAIALFVDDSFVRPIGGDFLVVILLYATVRGVSGFGSFSVLIGVLLFSYLIEFLQYLDFVTRLGLEDVQIARVVLGTYFSWIDVIAYTAGALFVLIVETKLKPIVSKWNTL
ncbi:ribosomal maturation YjgA family protein [Runella zeae]|uniref:ribosomal maturation YjgA family protein n=1 Tax=Runella zeae TaxID=94255 RepID=UPI000411B722|nr:DUF2809 domain-containing protein [Runella zeae]